MRVVHLFTDIAHAHTMGGTHGWLSARGTSKGAGVLFCVSHVGYVIQKMIEIHAVLLGFYLEIFVCLLCVFEQIKVNKLVPKTRFSLSVRSY